MMESNKTTVNHVCHYEDCNKTFSRPSRLIVHLRTHTGEKPFACSVDGCDKSYARKSHLDRHIDSNHRERATESFVCPHVDCTKVFRSSCAQNKHFKSAHQELKKYRCPEKDCDKAFNKRHQLRAHSYEHFGVLPFQCDYEGCKKQFKQSSHLLRHKEYHTATYTCDENDCQETFSKQCKLRKHKACVHKKLHTCNVCGKQFPRPVLLLKHKLCHESDIHKKMYKCPHDDCMRKYLQIRNLRAHIRTFHKQKKFSCNVDNCQKSFVNRTKLNAHIDKVHNSKPKKKKKYPKKATRKINPALKLLKYVVKTESPICQDTDDTNENKEMSELETESPVWKDNEHDIVNKKIHESKTELSVSSGKCNNNPAEASLNSDFVCTKRKNGPENDTHNVLNDTASLPDGDHPLSLVEDANPNVVLDPAISKNNVQIIDEFMPESMEFSTHVRKPDEASSVNPNTDRDSITPTDFKAQTHNMCNEDINDLCCVVILDDIR